MRKSASIAVLLLLVACKPDAKQDTPFDILVTRSPGDESTLEPVVSGGQSGTNPFPWNRYFVTGYDQDAVERLRTIAGYIANDFRFPLAIAGHPIYGGKGEQVRSHPLTAARLDYALSTGLTGTGQIVSMIDSGIRLSHDQFAGKTIYTSGGAPVAGDFHGTAVASVMVGTGNGGGTIGFAPGADIHQGYLDYTAPVNWKTLGSHMSAAAVLGAIVSNNSWGLDGSTVQNSDVTTYFQSIQRRPYVDGLRDFAKNGVIVFALQNDYGALSASLIAALPLGIGDLEANWISVVNAIPTFDDDRIIDAVRISTACLETARFCMTANGQIMVATETADDGYKIGIGASFAAPQVAGSIALLAEAFPDLSAAQLRDRLLATADNRFFTTDDSPYVTFAPGITHRYDDEFGHGFLDLRSALLPIGQAVVPTASGRSIDLGTAAILSGSATGDGLAQALSALTVVSTDQLHGSFSLSAAVLGGRDHRVDVAATALTAAVHPTAATARSSLNAAILTGTNLAGHKGVWADQTGADLLGSAAIPLTMPNSDLGLSVLSGGNTAGFLVHQTVDIADGSLRLGFASMRTDGSIIGVSVPVSMGNVSSTTNSVQLDVASRVTTGSVVRFDAEIGVANGSGAGMVEDFSAMSYNRVGVTVERADVRSTGDVLAMFVRRPIGITRGSAEMDMPVRFESGVTTFASQSVSLAPTERQLDLGFEYSTPVSRDGHLSFGMMYSDNDANTAGRRALSGFVGYQFNF